MLIGKKRKLRILCPEYSIKIIITSIYCIYTKYNLSTQICGIYVYVFIGGIKPSNK